ncbi:MAG: class I SAM-dependent methyltransferase [Rhodospirillaceae bacterium]|nr:class I SAM-dependent methyltransferase [Rhodospirillaceae bacterium]MYB15192.1 class I SAM-dependent methyltransferase [Rhodospirillaceae bacterium]MYI49544.1 class I SAM-dependent methyltransferase [Rhodospirillaceae bacterium]
MPDSGPASSGDRPGWSGYYRATADRPPRRTVSTALAALSRRPARRPGPAVDRAVDLGCGGGRDTAALLDAGCAVLAIDRAEEAGAALRARFPAAWQDGRLTFRRADFSDGGLDLPAACLVNAGFCLPSCPPERFGDLWSAIAAAVVPGGLFAGHLYGPNDSWARRGDRLTIHDRGAAEALLADWDLLLFEEEETDSVTPRGESKHWHIFHIVARKPA